MSPNVARKLVREVMTPDPLAVAPDATLRDVVEVLSSSHIGGVPVVAGVDHLLGVVSATDVMDFLASSPRVPTEGSEESVWDETGPTAQDEEQGASRAFLGLWSEVGGEVLDRFQAAGSQEWSVLDEHTAEEVMTRTLLTLPPDADVAEAARRMLEHGVHRLFVVEDGRLDGVVTTRDLIGVLAEAEGG
jgi:CBS domain-containing protein